MFKNEWILASPHSWQTPESSPVPLEHPRTILVFLKKVWGVFKAHIGLKPDWRQICSHHHPNFLKNPSCLKQQHVLAMLFKTKEGEKTSRQSYEQIGSWHQHASVMEFSARESKTFKGLSLCTNFLGSQVWGLKVRQVGRTAAQRGLLRYQQSNSPETLNILSDKHSICFSDILRDSWGPNVRVALLAETGWEICGISGLDLTALVYECISSFSRDKTFWVPPFPPDSG